MAFNALRAALANVPGLTVVGGQKGPTVICRWCKKTMFAGSAAVEESECPGGCEVDPEN